MRARRRRPNLARLVRRHEHAGLRQLQQGRLERGRPIGPRVGAAAESGVDTWGLSVGCGDKQGVESKVHTVHAVSVVEMVHQHLHAGGDALDDLGIGGEAWNAVVAGRLVYRMLLADGEYILGDRHDGRNVQAVSIQADLLLGLEILETVPGPAGRGQVRGRRRDSRHGIGM